MKPWKYLIIVAGMMSVVGLFAPLLTVKKAVFEQRLSARDLAVEGHRTNTLWQGKIPQLARDRLPAELRTVEQDIEDGLLATRFMALAFAPGIALLLIGLISAYRGRVGVFGGVVAVVLGLVSIAATFGLRWGIAQYSVDYLSITLEAGAYSPVLIGALGVVGGVGGITTKA